VSESRRGPLFILALALGLTYCHSPRPTFCATQTPNVATNRDSLRAAWTALRAVADLPDTLVCYRVYYFARDTGGYIVSVLPELRPQYAGRRTDGTVIEVAGGGARVRVREDGTTKVLERYQ